jgi:hypothetical protein
VIPKNAPPILRWLNLSAELWLHAVEHFGKRRAANRMTPPQIAAGRDVLPGRQDLLFAADIK